MVTKQGNLNLWLLLLLHSSNFLQFYLPLFAFICFYAHFVLFFAQILYSLGKYLCTSYVIALIYI